MGGSSILPDRTTTAHEGISNACTRAAHSAAHCVSAIPETFFSFKYRFEPKIFCTLLFLSEREVDRVKSLRFEAVFSHSHRGSSQRIVSYCSSSIFSSNDFLWERRLDFPARQFEQSSRPFDESDFKKCTLSKIQYDKY